jgi:hypothetical protein
MYLYLLHISSWYLDIGEKNHGQVAHDFFIGGYNNLYITLSQRHINVEIVIISNCKFRINYLLIFVYSDFLHI